MRIISGKYRGRKLISPEGNDVRPTSDQVKESIFNVIQFEIAGSRFVDLFSGSGNIGIEALSRGASEVIFADNNRNSISLIAQNLSKIEDNYKIINRDYKVTLENLSGKFEFIFVDAPFSLDCISNVCDIVGSKELLQKNGYIIYEHERSKNYKLSNDWYIAKSKTFGTIVVDYIAPTQEVCAVTGSFDPITVGHWGVIKQAMQLFDKINIIIAVNEEKKGIFSLEERKAFIEMCTKDYPNIIVDICKGMIYEYCNNNGIHAIVRGYRNEEDRQYEEKMAEFNFQKGGVTTTFIEADEDLKKVSSSTVKEMLQNGSNLRGFVPKEIMGKVSKLYKEKYNSGKDSR